MITVPKQGGKISNKKLPISLLSNVEKIYERTLFYSCLVPDKQFGFMQGLHDASATHAGFERKRFTEAILGHPQDIFLVKKTTKLLTVNVYEHMSDFSRAKNRILLKVLTNWRKILKIAFHTTNTACK